MAVSVLLSGTLKDGTSEKMAEMCDEGPYIDIFNIIDV